MIKAILAIMAILPMAHANIVGEDNRRSLSDADKLMRLDISADDAVRFRKVTGYVSCPGRKFGNGILGSGALIGGDNVLVTNAHILVDAQGRFREPLEECFFQNQAEPYDMRSLSFAEGDFEIVRDYAANKGGNDFAVVRLKEKIPGAKAFPVPEGGAPIEHKASFVAISAIGNDPLKFDPLIPVIQGCQIQAINLPEKDRNSVYIGDCDIVLGQSGSVNILKINGEWNAIGIVAGMGTADKNGWDYSIENGSYSFHVAIRDRLYLAIKRLSSASL